MAMLCLVVCAGGAAAQSHLSLRYVLQHADRINISYISDGVSVPLTGLNRSVNPRMLGILRKSTGFHAIRAKGKATILLSVETLDGKPFFDSAGPPPYEYVPETGELGSGSEWCNVPAEFRVWLGDLWKSTPKRHFVTRRLPGSRVIVEVVPRKPPLVEVKAFCSREHVLRVIDPKKPKSPFWPAPAGSAGCEVQYAMAKSSQAGPPRWKLFRVAEATIDQTFPPSFAGKTITYRFRWKYDDGTYGPWSKEVSAKVLP